MSELSVWEAAYFLILIILGTYLVACLVFSPITRRLDQIAKELKNIAKNKEG